MCTPFPRVTHTFGHEGKKSAQLEKRDAEIRARKFAYWKERENQRGWPQAFRISFSVRAKDFFRPAAGRQNFPQSALPPLSRSRSLLCIAHMCLCVIIR